MRDQADHYEFLEEQREKLDWKAPNREQDEDDLMDAERRAEEAENIRDGLREDGQSLEWLLKQGEE